MELSEAIPLLEQAYNEYTDASFFCKTAKGERKKALERGHEHHLWPCEKYFLILPVAVRLYRNRLL